MGTVNVIQNEVGGKELLLKAAQNRVASTIGGVKAGLTIQSIVLLAANKGIAGNLISIALVDPLANNAPLGIVVVGNAITVNLATGPAGAITSTTTLIVAALIASAPASALVAASGTGAVVVAAAATFLTGGVEGSAIVTSTSSNAKRGDLVRFNTVGALTAVIASKFYAVVGTPTATTFQIALTLGGTPIQMDATEAALDIDVFSTFGGLRSKSFGFASEAVDITNQDSDEYKKILDGAGARSFSLSGSGVYTNEALFQTVYGLAKANTLVELMLIEVKTGTINDGTFKITSMEISGDYNAESAYSMSAESSGNVPTVVLG